MHQALYRKWRPKTFSEVCGQEHITTILKQEAMEGKFNHAYLFCGSRGTGKTSCAKILSKVVNCLSPINGDPCGACEACLAIENGTTTDVLEMDAASNNGVDNIRDIRDEVVYSPSFLKYRVYIVDEVHMLSNSAFNALLKTLEEPPSHAIFILATTELQKLPATIVSRCQRFEFRRIATDVLTARIKFIAENEGIDITDDAARLIARYSQGGMRDSISLLDLCASSSRRIEVSNVNETIGSAGRERMMDVARAIGKKDFDFLFSEINEVVTSSKDITVFWQDLISLYRDMLVIKTVRDGAQYLDLTDFEANSLSDIVKGVSKEALIYQCKMLEEALASMQTAGAIKRMIAELCFVKMCDDNLSTSNEALLLRISRLEASLASIKAAPAHAVTESAEDTPMQLAADHTDARADAVPVKENEAKSTVAEEKTPRRRTAPAASVKPIKEWSEAVQTIQGFDMGAYSFLKKTRAYIGEDSRVHVLTDTLFAIDKPEIKRSLAASLSQYTGRTYTEQDIVYEKDNGGVSIDDDLPDIDDILNNF